ncbi:cytochrome c family protein, partial [Thioclava sp. BHET1]
MFDTMTLSKLLGAVCGGVLVLLAANYLGNMIYSPAEAGAPAYIVGAAAAETPTPVALTQGPDFKQALAEADVSHGQQLFSRCKACHRLDNKNATGPHLNGVVGRKVAGLQDYSYSG